LSIVECILHSCERPLSSCGSLLKRAMVSSSLAFVPQMAAWQTHQPPLCRGACDIPKAPVHLLRPFMLASCVSAVGVGVATTVKSRRGHHAPAPRRRRCRSDKASVRAAASSGTQQAHSDGQPHDLYVRVFVSSVEMVGSHGAIVGLQQLNDIEAPNHVIEVPMEFPILLDSEQTEEFDRARRGHLNPSSQVGANLDSLALCEIRVHAEAGEHGIDLQGELVMAEECQLPTTNRDDGLIRLEETVISKTLVPVSSGEALAVGLRVSVPVLLSTRRLLRAAAACVDRLRLEQSFCGGDDDTEGCDVELYMLSERLAECFGPDEVPVAQIAALIEDLKPLAWYWAERRRSVDVGINEYHAAEGSSRNTRSMAFADFRDRYERMQRHMAQSNATGIMRS